MPPGQAWRDWSTLCRALRRAALRRVQGPGPSRLSPCFFNAGLFNDGEETSRPPSEILCAPPARVRGWPTYCCHCSDRPTKGMHRWPRRWRWSAGGWPGRLPRALPEKPPGAGPIAVPWRRRGVLVGARSAGPRVDRRRRDVGEAPRCREVESRLPAGGQAPRPCGVPRALDRSESRQAMRTMEWSARVTVRHDEEA